MIIIAALGIFAGTLTLIVAPVVLRATGARGRLVAVLACLTGIGALGSSVAGLEAYPTGEALALIVVTGLIAAGLLVGSAVMIGRLWDGRRMRRQAALAIGLSAGLSLYAVSLALVASDEQGVSLTLTAALLPLLAVWGAWSVWVVRRTPTRVDPHRGVRRELMERVLSVTGYVIDPEAVLAMIRAAMLEAIPEARVSFRKRAEVNTLHGITATLSPELRRALEQEDAPVIDAATLVARHRSLRDQWADATNRFVLPVRRASKLYGAFELEVEEQPDPDDLLTASAMADHLAVKLENVSLSSSLGRAGRELERMQTFVEDLVESLPVGIVGISGPDLRVVLWNPFEAKRTGIRASDVLGERYLETVAPRHLEPNITDAIRSRPAEVLSFPNVAWKDTCRAHSVDVTVAPVRVRGGAERGYVLILVDTTERNVLQREVEEFRRFAALGQFAAAIAHDIRTPLSSIRMSVQILRSKVDLPEEDMEYFDLTLEAISRLARDVEELLDFTKPAFLRVEDISLRELAEDAREAVVCGYSRAVSIDLDVPDDMLVPVDEGHVRKMLVNLLQNAVEASEEGGRVRLEARCEGDDVRIVLSDEGRGIAVEDLDRIWEPFFTTRTDGTGLGLALVRKTVTAHGGSVAVTSELGQGTRFEVRLPAKRATEVLVPIEEYRKQVESERRPGSPTKRAG